jgi:hypothetical protein
VDRGAERDERQGRARRRSSTAARGPRLVG